MEQQKVKKIKKQQPKTHWLHQLLVFFVCFLAACVTWLAVMYTKEQANQSGKESPSVSDTAELSDLPARAFAANG